MLCYIWKEFSIFFLFFQWNVHFFVIFFYSKLFFFIVRWVRNNTNVLCKSRILAVMRLIVINFIWCSDQRANSKSTMDQIYTFAKRGIVTKNCEKYQLIQFFSGVGRQQNYWILDTFGNFLSLSVGFSSRYIHTYIHRHTNFISCSDQRANSKSIMDLC